MQVWAINNLEVQMQGLRKSDFEVKVADNT